MAVNIGDYVTIRNAGDTPVVYLYENQRHVLEPGTERVVPWGHMDKLMGNPFLTNATRARDRAMECARLHILYGTYGQDTERSPDWPKLEAYDPDGERIITILDDPTGENAPVQPSDTLDPGALRAQLATTQRRLQQLEQLLKVQDRSSPVAVPDDTPPPVKPDPTSPPPVLDDTVSDIPEDTPTKPPVRSRRS